MAFADERPGGLFRQRAGLAPGYSRKAHSPGRAPPRETSRAAPFRGFSSTTAAIRTKLFSCARAAVTAAV